MYKRDLEEEFNSWIFRDELLILTGSRQVGKSTFLKYIQSKINDQNIFINLEDLDFLSLFNKSPKNLIKFLSEKFDMTKKIFVFIDEIQYLDDPTNFLKYIYDEYKNNIKLIVSGSSAFYIDTNFKDSLSGRKKIFNLYPLSFNEFLVFKGENNLILKLTDFNNLTELTQNKILDYFDEFIKFGGYPKVVLENNVELKKQLISEILNSYIKKDITESKIDYPNKFYDLYKILCSSTGSLLNINELSSSLSISTTAIKNYLHILTKTFHIYELKPFSTTIRKEITKMPKFYIQDIGIKNYFEKNFNNISDRLDKGAIFETIVFNQLKIKYGLEFLNFWRTQDQQEIDFIISNDILNLALEVKYNKKNIKNNHLKSFLDKYPKFTGEIIDRNDFFERLC